MKQFRRNTIIHVLFSELLGMLVFPSAKTELIDKCESESQFYRVEMTLFEACMTSMSKNHTSYFQKMSDLLRGAVTTVFLGKLETS